MSNARPEPARRVFVRGEPRAIAVRGDGCFIEDSRGRIFLDMTGASQAVPLGRDTHSLTQAVRGFSGPVHLPAPFRSRAELALAHELVTRSFADRVFFCTSASESIEHAIRFARLLSGHKGRKIVSFAGSYHGATPGALAASDRPAEHIRYGPVPGLHRTAAWGTPEGIEVIDGFTCAVILEPIQAARGVRVAEREWLAAVRARCEEVGALLVFDESATGLGRTGHLWTHQRIGVEPHVLCTGSLAGGLPFHAVLVDRRLARTMSSAEFEPTPAASPFLSEVGLEVLGRVADPAFLGEVDRKAAWLRERLLNADLPRPLEVRGLGLHVGLQTPLPAKRVVSAAFQHGLIVGAVADCVVQLMPSLTVTREELEHAVDLLERALADVPRWRSTPTQKGGLL